MRPFGPENDRPPRTACAVHAPPEGVNPHSLPRRNGYTGWIQSQQPFKLALSYRFWPVFVNRGALANRSGARWCNGSRACVNRASARLSRGAGASSIWRLSKAQSENEAIQSACLHRIGHGSLGIGRACFEGCPVRCAAAPGVECGLPRRRILAGKCSHKYGFRKTYTASGRLPSGQWQAPRFDSALQLRVVVSGLPSQHARVA